MWMDEYALNQNNVAKVLHLHLSVALLSVTHVWIDIEIDFSHLFRAEVAVNVLLFIPCIEMIWKGSN